MSLFDKEELQELLDDTRAEAKEQGLSVSQTRKLVKKEFRTWLSAYTATLIDQIKIIDALDPALKDERVARADDDFHFFRLTYFPHYYRLEGESKLQEDLRGAYKKIIAPKDTGLRFAYAAPRGYGKSTDVDIAFVIYVIVKKKKNFPVIFSDAIELTETIIESIKVELVENHRLRADYPDACGETNHWRVGDIVTANGIRVKGYGSSKRVRGIKNGVFRPDLTIIDDLENDTNVRSRKQRDKLEEWLDEAVENLEGVDGMMDILYIGTLLHRDSVLARKLKLAYWHPKIFRALEILPKRMDLWEDYAKLYKYNGVEAAHDYYMSKNILMDEGAVLMWDVVKLEHLMIKRIKSLKAFNKEQQNNPNSEHQKFDSSKFARISHTQMPKLDKKFLYVDAKGDSDSSGDPAGFVGAGISNETKKLYIFYSKSIHIKGSPVITEILRLQTLYNFDVISGDKNGGFYMLRDWLKEKAWEKGVTIKAYKFIHHTMNKEDRMGELEYPIDDGDIVFVGDHPELFAQMDDFPEADHDDLHDPLSAIYNLSKLKRVKSSTNKRTNIRHSRPRR